MEAIVKGMFKTGVYFETIYILTMTDYDPAGYYIAEALIKQVQDILFAIGKHKLVNVETHRIGITPDQLSDLDIQENMYSPKKANIKKWMDRTGGINGEEKGLELDAFNAKEIREIFIENLKNFIDITHYDKFIKESYIKNKILNSIKERLDKTVEKVTNEVIDEIEVKDFDIHKFGVEGQSMLYIEDLCEDSMDDIISILTNKYL